MGNYKIISILLLASLPLWAGCGGSSGGGPDAGSAVGDAPMPLDVPVEVPPRPEPEQEPEPEPEVDPVDVQVQEVRIDWGGDDSQQFGILYLPENATETLPVVVMIHGGCWLGIFGLDYQTDLSLALASRGFAVWNIEYRRLGTGGEWPVIFQDAAAAVDFLPAIAAQYNLDLNAVSAMGHSAGGHLALWLAGRQAIVPGGPLYQAQPLPIRGVVALGPVTDLEARICASSIPRLIDSDLLSGAQLASRLSYTSPLAMLPIGVASIVVSGSEDNIAPAPVSQAYVDAAVQAGDFSEHLVIDGADHFDIIDSNFIDMALLVNILQQVQSRTLSK